MNTRCPECGCCAGHLPDCEFIIRKQLAIQQYQLADQLYQFAVASIPEDQRIQNEAIAAEIDRVGWRVYPQEITEPIEQSWWDRLKVRFR